MQDRYNELINLKLESEATIKEIEEANKDMSEFADYLIENASYAFETQDRELLEKVLLNYIDMKLKEQ
ncbi:hypothetical protein [uncultured Clostridium sp.]|jgi:F0F1-type ATP synthase gamma subunit|uniref:hypothetical protein n=1 Tax=uncultured Clostridium sp. TaxID=59620 RepID=UPI0025DD6954|nr:hypothetical protein [uncultured Clostridium sp.]